MFSLAVLKGDNVTQDVKKKKCIKCGCDLDSSNTTWYRQKNYIHKCNDCMRDEKRIQAREKYQKNPTSSAARSLRHSKKMKKNFPVKYTASQMYSSAKKRSNKLGLPFDLDSKYVESICPKLCPVFGHKIKYGGGEKTKYSASIDRIEPSKGYTKDNVQVISLLANLMKNEASVQELLAFSAWVYDTQNKTVQKQ